MPRRTRLTFVALGALVVASGALALLAGHGRLSDPALRAVFLDLRATRAGAAFLVGSALAVAGVVVQGLFRNPLVSPSILGTTAGASFGGQAALLLVAFLPSARPALLSPDLMLPVGCIAGALGSLAIVLAFDRTAGAPGGGALTLLLTGFILSSLFLSLGAFITSIAQESWDVGRAVVAFTLGGVSGAGHLHLMIALPLVASGIIASWVWGRSLDLLLSGEEEAATLGVDVEVARRLCILWVSVLAAAAVALGGNVGFVGLIVPHVLRPFVGARHRVLIPACALGGGCFVVLADALGRALPIRSEIPLGVVTGIIGAPLFLTLLLRSRRELEHG